LENAIVRAAVLCDQVIRPEDLPERIRNFSKEGPTEIAAQSTARRDEGEMVSLFELEGRHIARVLAHTSGNKLAAARILGIDRTTLQRMVKRHNLDTTASGGGNSDEKAVI
jgi:DNA-binding NtrC family response regulator